jgi:hypothetical protein
MAHVATVTVGLAVVALLRLGQLYLIVCRYILRDMARISASILHEVLSPYWFFPGDPIT